MRSLLHCVFLVLLLLPNAASAKDNILNVYGWSAELPSSTIRQFEKETGIKVNFSTYENNEIMYAKLRAMKTPSYDVVFPSSYFVDRMRRQDMLEKLDKSKLSNWKNLDPEFLHPSYDPHTEYSMPYLWGITGIFINTRYHSPNTVHRFANLWEGRFKNQLMVLDDTRELFSMAFLSMGYSVNDKNPEHIKAAFLKLQKLMPNIKVFASDAVASIMIDEDATIGIAWNGDATKAAQENSKITFIYPKEGFVIWVDNLIIPKGAPHREAAYLFANFLLREDVGKEIALFSHYPTANLAAKNLLPEKIRSNTRLYPSKETMKRGEFQLDVGEKTLALYEKYWEELKMSA